MRLAEEMTPRCVGSLNHEVRHRLAGLDRDFCAGKRPKNLRDCVLATFTKVCRSKRPGCDHDAQIKQFDTFSSSEGIAWNFRGGMIEIIPANVF